MQILHYRKAAKFVLGCVAVLLLPFALLADDAPKVDFERRDFNRCRAGGETWDDQIAAYQKFIEKYPQSSLVDDAYLEIAERQRKARNFDETRRTLEYVKNAFPNGEVLRIIHINDIQEKWLPEWELFANQNPIAVADYVDLKLAELDFKQANYDTAPGRIKKLVMRTKTPSGLRKSLNPTIRTAFDVNIAALELSLSIAEKNGDQAWEREIKTLLQKAGNSPSANDGE
jgi:hypothetical protein